MCSNGLTCISAKQESFCYTVLFCRLEFQTYDALEIPMKMTLKQWKYFHFYSIFCLMSNTCLESKVI